MNIEQLMTKTVVACAMGDTMETAARIMWEHDCGIVPIVDADRRAVGVITDRDICMAALTQRKPLGEMPVSIAASKALFAVHPSDAAADAEALMQAKQVRRLVVVDDDGRLVGILSLNDLARRSGKRVDDLGRDEIARTLAAISRPSPTAQPAPN